MAKFKELFKESLWTGGSINKLDKNIRLEKEDFANFLKYKNSKYILCREYKDRNNQYKMFNSYSILGEFNTLEEIENKNFNIRNTFYVFEMKSIVKIIKHSKYKKSHWIACKWDENTAKLSPKEFFDIHSMEL